jgi:dUTP pyrophosphatase
MQNVQVRFKKLHKDAKAPFKASKGAACFDIYSNVNVVVCPNSFEMIGAGLAVEIPEGYEIKIYSRSGHASKEINLANCVGIVDSDYRGEVCVMLRNNSSVNDFPISVGERIAQIQLCKVIPTEFIEADALSDTDRGVGGFGSTGVK